MISSEQFVKVTFTGSFPLIPGRFTSLTSAVLLLVTFDFLSRESITLILVDLVSYLKQYTGYTKHLTVIITLGEANKKPTFFYFKPLLNAVLVIVYSICLVTIR